MSAADVLRILLFLDVLGMALLAAFYLRRRELSWWAYLLWGLVALLIPILGPFLVIASRPGHPRVVGKRSSRSSLS